MRVRAEWEGMGESGECVAGVEVVMMRPCKSRNDTGLILKLCVDAC